MPNEPGMVWIESVPTYWAAIYHITDRRACSFFSTIDRLHCCEVLNEAIQCFHLFMPQGDLEVIQGHEK